MNSLDLSCGNLISTIIFILTVILFTQQNNLMFHKSCFYRAFACINSGIYLQNTIFLFEYYSSFLMKLTKGLLCARLFVRQQGQRDERCSSLLKEFYIYWGYCQANSNYKHYNCTSIT